MVFSLVSTASALSNTAIVTAGGSNVCGLPMTFTSNVSLGATLTVAGAVSASNLVVTGNAINFGDGSTITTQNWATLMNHVVPVTATAVGAAAVKAVSSGSAQSHSAVVVAGAVYACGLNDYGQLGLGDTVDRTAGPVLVPGISNAVAVVCGERFTAVLTSASNVYAFGRNDRGQLGQPVDVVPYSAVPLSVPGLSNVAGLDCGFGHALFALSDGTVVGLGDNSRGQLGDGATSAINASLVPMTLPVGDARDLACGSYHSMVVMKDGTTYACGDNTYGQIGVASNLLAYQATPGIVASYLTAVDGATSCNMDQVVWAACGTNHTILVRQNGDVVTFGYNNLGQLGTGTVASYATPQRVLAANDAASSNAGGLMVVDGGAGHTVVATNDAAKTVWVWGDNTRGQLGMGMTSTSYLSPTVLAGYAAVAVGCGLNHTLLLLADNTFRSCGDNGKGQTGDGQALLPALPYRYTPNLLSEGLTVSVTGTRRVLMTGGANDASSAFVEPDGTVCTMGFNGSGQLGDGSITNRPYVTPVSRRDSRTTRVASGGNHKVALASDGTLWAWGNNWYGQLGITTGTGATGTLKVPTLINGGTGLLPGSRTATAVAAGASHTVAVASDGTVHAWGYNNYGQLGITTTGPTTLAVPALVNGGTGLLPEGRTATAIACGGSFTVALASDGTLHVWGHNGYGQLGVTTTGPGNTTALYVPAAIDGGTGLLFGDRTASAVACGAAHTVALATDGTVHAWGQNAYGNLGITTGAGNTVSPHVPVLINGGTGLLVGSRTAVAIACGGNHTVALATDGTVHAWGYNPYGQLGTGNSTTLFVPTLINGGTGLLAGSRAQTAVALACGSSHTIALASDGTLHAWGLNANGQLGLGDTANRSVPTQVTLTNRSASASPRILSTGFGLHKLIRDPVTRALTAAGTNDYYQIGDNTATTRYSAVVPTGFPFAGNPVVAWTASRYHSVVVLASGATYAWGRNATFECGLGSTTGNLAVPTLVSTVGNGADAACGDGFTVLVLADRSVVTLGRNGAAGTLGVGSADASLVTATPQVVAGLTDVAKVAAGTANVAALDYSGNLWVWGDNTYGQLGMSPTTFPAVLAPTLIPVGSIVASSVAGAGGMASTASRVVDVAFGDKHLLVLTDDGRVFSCGGNRYGQLGYWTATLDTDAANATFAEVFLQADPNGCSTAFPTAPMTADACTLATGDHVASASAGALQSPYLAFDDAAGTVWTTDTGTYETSGGYGYLGAVATVLAQTSRGGAVLAGEWVQLKLPRQIALASVTVTPDSAETCPGVLTVLGSNDGVVWSPLGSSGGNTGIAAITVVATTCKNKFDFFRVVFTGSAGTAGYVAVQSVVLTGGVPLEALPVAVCCGLNHSVVQVSNNTIRTFGRDASGQLGAPAAGRIGYRWLPAKPMSYADVVNVAAGQDVTYVEAYLPEVASALTVPRMRGYGANELARGPGKWFVGGGSQNNCTLFVNDQGKLYGWGYNGGSELGNGGTANAYTSILVSVYGSLTTRGVTLGACGNNFTVALASDGTLHSWGTNNNGQLGTSAGSTMGVSIPTMVNNGTGLLAGGRSAVAVACGNTHTVALAADGTLHSWGFNAYGQLGTNTGVTTNATLPTIVNNGTGLLAGGRSAVAIACGASHTVALASDGTLHSWGSNNIGQLGTNMGGTMAVSIPTIVNESTGLLAGGRTAIAIACGGSFTVAIASDGTLHAWGQNAFGQLGTGTTVTAYIPTILNNGTGLLAGNRSAISVACGLYHTVALASDGTLHSWGQNTYGQVGSSGLIVNLPTIINNGTGLLAGSRTATAFACGQYATVALATDGTLHTWGQNSFGQLGTGDTLNYSVPTLININAVAATTLFVNFTGQHRCFVDGHGFDTLPSLEGRIVCASKNQYITTSGPGGGDTAFQVDADAITTNDALPVVALSTKPRDKSAFGVVSLVANFEDLDASGADPAATLARLREQGDVRAEINSVGEGALWVCDAARDADTGLPVPLESGDLVTTSAVPGYGMRQDDDLWHGYTVAKITMDCDFDPPLVPVRRLLKDAMGNNVVDPATGKPVFEVVTDATAAADAADPPVPRLKPAYRLRYLRADGTDLADRAAYDAAAAAGEAVHLAAFVGCTYHC